MKQLLLGIIVAFVAVVGASALPRTGVAIAPPPAGWPALAEDCYDVTGDGRVDLLNDILGVINHFGTKPGDDDYALLYDVDGGGVVDLLGDVLGTVGAFNTTCSLIDTQVVLATAGTLRYQDCDAAIADGYTDNGVWVPNMGIHIYKNANLSLPFYDPSELSKPPAEQQHQLTQPFGLVCTEKPTGAAHRPDKLIGVWYIMPTEATAPIHGYSGPTQPNDEMPVGFGTTADDEDNLDETGVPNMNCVGLCNAGWHIHWNLCVGFSPGFLTELGADHPDPEGHCFNTKGGALLVNPYGWMLHFYNFIPNPEGRFLKWNTNPDLQRYMP